MEFVKLVGSVLFLTESDNGIDFCGPEGGATSAATELCVLVRVDEALSAPRLPHPFADRTAVRPELVGTPLIDDNHAQGVFVVPVVEVTSLDQGSLHGFEIAGGTGSGSARRGIRRAL